MTGQSNLRWLPHANPRLGLRPFLFQEMLDISLLIYFQG